MISGVSSTEQSQAATPQQASLLAARNEVRQQQELAERVVKQAEATQTQIQPRSNPEGLGGQVDTFA